MRSRASSSTTATKEHLITPPPTRTPAPVLWLVERFERLVAGRPRTVLALKAAVAAGLAWLVVIPFSGVADDYPYYAPLGAVVVTSTTVMTSVRTSLQALAALAIGAGLAVVVVQAPVAQVVAVMLVVGIGTALASWQRLGEMSAYVPFTALFVLIIGGEDPSYYVLGYGGLTAVGAAVGVAVNLALPQLPLGRTLQALADLQEELSRQLRSLAEDLRTEDDLGTDSARISGSVAPAVAAAGPAGRRGERRAPGQLAGRSLAPAGGPSGRAGRGAGDDHLPGGGARCAAGSLEQADAARPQPGG